MTLRQLVETLAAYKELRGRAWEVAYLRVSASGSDAETSWTFVQDIARFPPTTSH